MKERNPVKGAHHEWLIRSWWWQGFWNYAVKEVRDYRLSIIREVAEQYDFDGVHLDFLRHTPFLPPGKQWENREHLTSFMRDVRSLLQSQAAKRGRPFMLAARVPVVMQGSIPLVWHWKTSTSLVAGEHGTVDSKRENASPG